MTQDVHLSESLAAFLQGGLSVMAACCADGVPPAMGRVIGCRVAADRAAVTVYLPRARCRGLIEIAQPGRPLAVVYSEPTTHRSVQLKGPILTVAPAGRADALLARYAGAFADQLDRIGFDGDFTRALLGEPADVVAVTFRPAAVFDQTPGPRAGEALAP